MSRPTTCRPLQTADLDQLLALQRQCYGDAFLEPRGAFEAKLQAAPDACWVAERQGELIAYLVSLPVEGSQLPSLHATQWLRPAAPQWLYLHDMAVAPQARGSGAAATLLAHLRAFAQSLLLTEIGLIAVQGSQTYWARQGFVAAPDDARMPPAKLATFGPQACFMRCQI
jgi:ribosomal protein S18 acetylase RimI-like enzyme